MDWRGMLHGSGPPDSARQRSEPAEDVRRSDLDERPPGWRRLLPGCAVFAALGAAAMLFFQGQGLTSGSMYHMDMTQSPHWIAYHGDEFAGDDLLVEYSTFNESPIQNAIYWVGTWFVDVVLLNKLVGVAIFGLTAALFFGLVGSTSGVGAGVLAASFFIVFPRSTYEIAGGFSKAWAIGFVLIAVYVVERRKWPHLLWILPLAALAYPIAAVMIGAIALAGLALELRGSATEAFRGFKHLCGASALGVVPLLYKYLTPSPRIGEMISTDEMKAMWERRESSSVTLPLWEETLTYFQHPFFVYSIVLLLMLLAGRRIVWKRSWTALVVASVISYHVADLVVPRLYLPDRYSRFSVAVLLVLFLAHNWARLLEFFGNPWARRAAAAALVALAALSFPDTFRPCIGEQSQGVWEDRGHIAGLSDAVASLPGPVLVAGHPYSTADVLVQARRPVLVVNRLFHAWFPTYRALLDERHRAIFTAFYAKDVDGVNQLADRYGVTHLIVRRQDYSGKRFRQGRIYRREYNEFVSRLTAGGGPFVLNPPPRRTVLYQDQNYYLVQLPL